MAAAPIHQPKINLNLLYPQGLPQKLPVKFLKWLLSFGRYIAVFVEIIVLVAFALRFKLDGDLVKINEEINQQIPFIESLAQKEALIRHTQFKIETIKKTYDESASWKTIFTNIADQTPGGISLKSVVVNKPEKATNLQFTLNGQAITNNDLALFLYGLNEEKTFIGVNLTNLGFDQGVINFTIKGGLK